MQKRTIDRKMKNGKTMEITVEYENGKGYPYREKGIYARITEIKVTPFPDGHGGAYNLVTWSTSDPYKTCFLEKIERGSQKKVDAWAKRIEGIADDILRLWEEQQYTQAAYMVFTVPV